MLTRVQIRDLEDTLLTDFPVSSMRPSDSMFVKDITGISPVSSSVSISDYALSDGGVFSSARTGTRNIVMTLGFLPGAMNYNGSVYDLRNELYRYVAPGGRIKVVFLRTDEVSIEAEGVVESVEPSIFAKDPEIQVSILCPSPYFRSRRVTVISGNTGIALNDFYSGTAPTGFLFEYTARNPQSAVRLNTPVPDNTVRYAHRLESNDILRISTVQGDKYVTKISSGTYTNGVRWINMGTLSMWIGPRTTWFLANLASAQTDPYTLRYHEQFLGV